MAEEHFNEHEAEVIPDNSQPQEVEGSDNVLENNGGGGDDVAAAAPPPSASTGDAIGVPEKKWPGWPGENVFRMLVPTQKVGGIIGRKGEYIKKTCEETKARIKILEGPPGTSERTVLISAKEEPDLAIPPAVDGLLKVHKRIIDIDAESSHAPPVGGGKMVTRLLVAATQGGSLIGKQGATIKTIQDASHCTIRVLGGENLPVFAIPDDSVIEVQGEPTGVHTAIELIATHLRKFLVDRSVVGIFEKQMQMSNARPNQDMLPPQSWGPPPQGFPMNAHGGPGFGPTPPYMPPQRQFDNYYPPVDVPPPMDKQPRQVPPSYGRDAGSHTSNLQPQQSMVTKVSQNMQIPLLYADAVIGTSGTNISYIRRASGATIAIQETRGVPDEMTVEINGSASQCQTAQQLIQNFIADAASAAAQNSAGPPPGQGGGGGGYNTYPPGLGGPTYPAQPPNPTGHVGHPPPPAGGDYGSVYGGNYGY